jgi:hypothetical protein
MKNRIKLILISAIASISLSNCIDVHQVVNVKKDGSGTIEETMLVSVPEEAKALTGGGDLLAPLRDEAQLKKRAEGLGVGVEFVSVEEIKGKNGNSGMKVIYKFAEVSKVTLNPDAGLATILPQLSKMIKKDETQTFKFGFEKGDPATLTINTPQMKGIGDMGDKKIDPIQFAMMGELLKSMRARITIRPEGEITKTNATHSDSNSVTIVDLEMGKFAGDPEKLEQLTALAGEKDRDKVAAKLKELGIRSEAKEEVKVEFK